MPAHSKHLGNFSFTVGIDPSVIVARAEAARAQALPLIGEYIRAQSVAIAPLRDGGLIASSRVETEQEKVKIGFYKIYANYQHEGENFNHPNGRQAKYLEKVMEDPATERAVDAIFAAKLKAQIGG